MWLWISLVVSSCAVILCLTTTHSREISLISSDKTLKPLGYDINPLLPGSLCTVAQFVAFTHLHQKQCVARICRHNYFLSKYIIPSEGDKRMCPVLSRTGRWIKTSEQKFWWNCLAELRESLAYCLKLTARLSWRDLIGIWHIQISSQRCLNRVASNRQQ